MNCGEQATDFPNSVSAYSDIRSPLSLWKDISCFRPMTHAYFLLFLPSWTQIKPHNLPQDTLQKQLYSDSLLCSLSWDRSTGPDFKTELFLQAASSEYIPGTSLPGQVQLSAILELHVAWYAGNSAFRHKHTPVDGRVKKKSRILKLWKSLTPNSPFLYSTLSQLEVSTITKGIRARAIYIPHAIPPILLPGFYFSPQNYQYPSCHIFYYLFTITFFRTGIYLWFTYISAWHTVGTQ